MFSGSNSYLGGANSARGQPQHGQPNGFGPQPTGYGQQPLQNQYTGFPGQQEQQPLQNQYTGFPGQAPQQSFQQAPQQQPFQTGYQPQQQSFQQQPPPQSQPQAQPQRSQPTGMTSSQIADSFRASQPQAPTPSPAPVQGSRIPNVRLSFITADDQAKFEQLFKSAVGNDGALSGDKARDLLLRSKLSGDALSQIWYVSNTITR